MTYDQMALKILLGGGSETTKQAALKRLASDGRAALNGRHECPRCGFSGPHDDNGLSGSMQSFMCVCGEQWDAE
jgi:hypothetical protein